MEIRERLLEFKHCFDKSPVAVGIVKKIENQEGQVCDLYFCYSNQALADLIGRKLDVLQDTSLYQQFPIADSHWVEFYQLVVGSKEAHKAVMYSEESERYLKAYAYQMQEDYCVMILTDVTEEKLIELDLIMQQRKSQIALENSEVDVWEYDIQSKQLYQRIETVDGKEIVKAIDNIPESAIENGTIHPESVQDYRNIYASISNGSKDATADVHYIEKNGEDIWKRIKFITVFDDAGMPIKAVGCTSNLTLMKGIEQRYNEELIYKDAINADNLLAKIKANLSANLIDEMNAECKLLTSTCKGDTFTNYVEIVRKTIFKKEQQEEFNKIFDINALRKAYETGEKKFSFEYQRRLKDESIIWVETTTKLLKKPNTDELMCFTYTYDINDKKMTQALIDTVVSVDYEFILEIDVHTGKYNTRSLNMEADHITFPESGDFEELDEQYIQDFVVEEDRERCKQELRISSLCANLENDTITSVTYGMKGNKGESKVKRIQALYIDDTKRNLCLTRTDITDLTRKEEQKKEVLRQALIAAEQANNAKSEFLSRMSHEIRTPMNAIIGMSTLAAQCINDPEQVSDCLSKVGISARFLLSLINDILDMSRIESGKVNIKQEKIAFEEFLAGIDTICYAQAEEKKVEFDSILTSYTEDYYIGDATKLQQILINVISNAIKFTPAGGKVQFIINEERIKQDQAVMQFTINDTGVGISDEFLPHLFEPFTQESIGATSTYGGTGLGLAICKNLVALMDGSISVNSIEGIGTEFIIKIKLGISKDSKHHKNRKVQQFNYSTLRALIIDDDVLICRHTKQILADMGIVAEWVDSGQKAIDKVKRKLAQTQHYDVILVDWKMPGMDGIETTRRLREIVGKDVTIIIMTAYDWFVIEQEAKAAGVDVLISKPIFESSLTNTFAKLYHSEEIERESREKEKIEEYDFSGKRVLLVEDHILNIEVAKRLLLAKSLEVDVCENGLQAIERFAKAEEGYYQAILMDIRMPIMDGITATKSIRQMKHRDAKTIPIIAMTANAFDEDVEETKAAGMNAHLAKPIEPEMMYQTLQNLF
ncbi:MAG: response regulator [Lachnospiraceae bacterium]